MNGKLEMTEVHHGSLKGRQSPWCLTSLPTLQLHDETVLQTFIRESAAWTPGCAPAGSIGECDAGMVEVFLAPAGGLTSFPYFFSLPQATPAAQGFPTSQALTLGSESFDLIGFS
jgi:hypothetical protein